MKKLMGLVLTLGLGFFGCGADSAHDEVDPLAPGSVLEASAAPFEMTLTEMAGEVAQFNMSGNDQQYYPATPFQMLYQDGSTIMATTVPDGNNQKVLAEGTNTFDNIPEGTYFYIPLFNYDDTPPIYGPYPVNNEEARDLFFAPTKYGGTYSVTVDGKETVLGPDYVVGPVDMKPLPNRSGTHIIVLGAFVAPMAVGDHEVIGRVYQSGDAAHSDFNGKNILAEFTYTVHVVPQK